jgi:hypothetical protein
MHTKTITQNIDWLREIDGLTVRAAIEYLSKLNPEHVLNYSLEGDTHGCQIESDVTYTVPMTNKEILLGLERRYLQQIKHYEEAKQKRLKEGRAELVASCEKNLLRLHSALDEARAEYGEK